ncbi:MAG: DNA mismatch repair protein MutS, partial [Hymenobacter sp.]
LRPGGSEHSFGIHVARMAGMPPAVVLRANEIMHHLEQERAQTGLTEPVDPAAPTEFDDVLAGLDEPPKNAQPRPRATTAVASAPKIQLSMFEPGDPKLEQLRELLQLLDINTLTPIEALLKLQELKGLAGS